MRLSPRLVAREWVGSYPVKGARGGVAGVAGVGNLTFQGEALCSGQTTIARRICLRGKIAYVRDAGVVREFLRGRWLSTARHVEYARLAIDEIGAKRFDIHRGKYGQDLNFTAASLRDYYYQTYHAKIQVTHHLDAIRARHFMDGVRCLGSAADVCTHFGILGEDTYSSILMSLGPRIRAAREVMDKRAETLRLVQEKIKAERSLKLQQEEEERRTRAKATAGVIISRGFMTDNESESQMFGINDSMLNSYPDLQLNVRYLRSNHQVQKLTEAVEGARVLVEQARIQAQKAEEKCANMIPKIESIKLFPGRIISLED